MITIKALKNYTDNELKAETENKTKITRNFKQIEAVDGKVQKGDFYTVNNDRAMQIINANLAVLVAIPKEDKIIAIDDDGVTISNNTSILEEKPKKKANKGNK